MALETNAHRKTLFRTPCPAQGHSNAGTSERASEAIDTFLKQSNLEQEVESGCKILKAEIQVQRLKKLRQQLETLAHDDWKYPSVESLIGFKLCLKQGMAMSTNDPVVLSYGNALLRQSDLKVLDGPFWLTDCLISFFFEYLDKVFRSKDGARLVFVSAEMAQLFKMGTRANANFFSESLQLSSADMVFLPVNDESSCLVAGGTHWSLLVYDRSDNTFWHYDSCGGFNEQPARQLIANLWPCLAEARGITPSSDPLFHEAKCRQQQNSYDCGLFVVFNARAVAEDTVLKRIGSNSDQSDSELKRQKLKCLILKVVADEDYAKLF